MRLLIFVYMMCVAALYAQNNEIIQSNNNEAERAKVKSQEHVIDFQNPEKKIVPLKKVKSDDLKQRQNRKFGPANTSGPAEKLAKKPQEESSITNRDLQVHLKNSAQIKPLKNNP